MSYALRAGLSFCRVEERLLFLDLIVDRYFCLSTEAERAFFRLYRAEPLDAADQARLARLIAAGLIVDSGRAMIAPCPAAPPVTYSLIDAPTAERRVAGCAAALLSLSLARIELRIAGMARALARISRRKHRLRRDACFERVARVAAAFEAANALVSAHDRCLPRSLAVAHRLIDVGAAPDLVLGVKLAPFRAHAWIQCGEALVNERLEVVRQFTPILVL
ncbi:lasso peptide biosynthesis B2 protein [Sphingomonas sp. ERG5]|uniref:lasso peptide biosynthesis B2 protein n=1 Tax=Sphingomonas sp. ERG5 TaxID=1381597 RepID=UPI00054BCE8B|nr:lasso peptide biosynthesis B2 protein [Sphingomonas sp. ERG5]